MLLRESQTWDLGIRDAISRGVPELTVWADRFCNYQPDPSEPITFTSCRRDANLLLEPSIQCPEGEVVSDCVDQDTGQYTPCSEEDWPGNCSPGSSRQRFGIAHELGHFVEATALGAPDIFGIFDSFVHPYTFDGQPDPAGIDERCSCAHITTSNQFHCMQSVEVGSAAFVEGFAQFFAAKVFNNPDEDDCGFAYYKEFLHGDFSIEFPPVELGCRLPYRWRNSQCISADTPQFSGVAVNDLGTELDWLTFLWNVNTVGDFKLGATTLFEAIRFACSGDPNGDCLDVALSWADGVLLPEGMPRGLESGATQYFNTVSRDPNAAAKLDFFLDLSDEHGVSRDTTPIQ